MTPARVVSLFLIVRPLRGAIRPYVPSGHLKEIPVGTSGISPGSIVLSELSENKSYPAVCFDPCNGGWAVAESFCTRSICVLFDRSLLYSSVTHDSFLW